MTLVTCECLDCANRDTDGCCVADYITISDGCCADRSDYTMGGAYRSEFWIATIDRETGKAWRMRRFGKRLELFGLTFFTKDDDRYPWECSLTEETTGIYCGLLSNMTEVKSGDIAQHLNEYARVMDLPVEQGQQDDGEAAQ